MHAFLQPGLDVVFTLQRASPLLDWPALVLTQLGSEIAFMLLTTWIYWHIDRRFGFRLTMLLIVSALVNGRLKLLWRGPRPYRYDARVRLIGSPLASGGLPSGHAQLSTTFWGVLPWRFRVPKAWPVAIAIVLLVSTTRLYLGVHFPHDVIVGILLGLVAVAAFIAFERWYGARRGDLSSELRGSWLWLLTLASSAGFLLLAGVQGARGVGIALGLVAGEQLSERMQASTRRGPPWREHVVPFSIGATALATIHWMGAALYKRLELSSAVLTAIVLLLRYGLVAAWIGGLWPCFATRLHRSA